uniref:Uncharacterized protein n=1 Tax=Caenorhabditis japonica TaxID=281687 RepID=A0A8R1EPL9_CAEJA
MTTFTGQLRCRRNSRFLFDDDDDILLHRFRLLCSWLLPTDCPLFAFFSFLRDPLLRIFTFHLDSFFSESFIFISLIVRSFISFQSVILQYPKLTGSRSDSWRKPFILSCIAIQIQINTFSCPRFHPFIFYEKF